MFGLFGKRKKPVGPYEALLNLPAGDFVSSVTAVVRESDRASKAMVLVALANLDTYLAVLFDLARKEPSQKLPTNLDGAIGFFEQSLADAQSEVGSRRLHWFLIACLVKRASNLGTDAASAPKVAQMWGALADACVGINGLLESNMLWEQQEKEWFSHTSDAKAARSYVICHMMPKPLRKQADVAAYCV